MSKEKEISEGYVLTKSNAKIITDYFDAIDQMTIVNCQEKKNVFELLGEIVHLLSDNEIINGWDINNVKKLISQTNFKETNCIL